MSNLKVNTINDASGGNAAKLYGVSMRDGGTGWVNRIINGDMRIDQRNAGASVTPTTSAYTIDRWQANISQSSKFSVQQNAGSVTPPVGFSNYLGCTSLSAYSVVTSDSFTVGQYIEGLNTADLGWGSANAQTVTISFWVRSSLTGTFGGAISNNDVNRSYPFTYTISAANTWEQKTITVAGDTSGTWLATNSTGVRVFFGLGAGATKSGTAGTWAAADYRSATGATSVVGTSGATFYITGVQLEAGTVASPFERRDYGRELMMCQRYYAFGDHYTLLPAGAVNVLRRDEVRLPVTMRAAPTVTFNDNVTSGYVYRNSAQTATIFNTASGAFRLQTANGGGATQDDMFFNWFAAAEL